MTHHDEMLQRCFDNDLTDDELKTFFAALAKERKLRDEYKEMHVLRNDLRAAPSIPVPAALDERVNAMIASHRRRFIPDASPVRRFFSRRLTLSIPAFAALIVLMLAGSFYAATTVFRPVQQTAYVYVVEMPAYVVQSTVYDVVNN
jgi:negative regulator of sigma E activity